MSAKELKLTGGLTDMRVNYDSQFVHLIIQTVQGSSSMLVSLDRSAQHLLLLYLQEHLAMSPAHRGDEA